MDRRNFLALIPAISSIPIIGSNIVKKKDVIEIYQPEEVDLYTQPLQQGIDFARCELYLVQDGRVMHKGLLTNLSINCPHDRPMCVEVGGVINDFAIKK